jgi:ribosomal-protein-alanine N-acetyltransferase
MMRHLARLFARREAMLSPASPRDAAAIAAIHAASFHRGWSEQEVETLLLDRHVVADLVRWRGKPVGFIISRFAADEAEILSVAVARAAQGRGFSGRLLDLHLRRLAGLGAHAVFLEVDEHNIPAIRLYARAGFREVARRPNYFATGKGLAANALVLRRDLG